MYYYLYVINIRMFKNKANRFFNASDDNYRKDLGLDDKVVYFYGGTLKGKTYLMIVVTIGVLQVIYHLCTLC
mgnify:CR=1 FL=1